MSKIKMDAIEVATSIHEGNFSKLHGKSFEMCDNKNMKGKYTLNELGNKIDQIADALFAFIKTTNTRFDNLEKRIDSLEKNVKDINARLDYIVKANNLKDLPD